uniref:Uncharacterized protein n=1 Tax=Anguilla anguilla TaxID=7936 RepID=A0A0E9WD07_ANGAN
MSHWPELSALCCLLGQLQESFLLCGFLFYLGSGGCRYNPKVICY